MKAKRRQVQEENLSESLCRLRKVHGRRRYGQSAAVILREGPKVQEMVAQTFLFPFGDHLSEQLDLLQRFGETQYGDRG